jgi:hypothetical protein
MPTLVAEEITGCDDSNLMSLTAALADFMLHEETPSTSQIPSRYQCTPGVERR